MLPIVIRPLASSELRAASRLLSRAMCNNPIDVYAFGGEVVDRLRSLERFYAPVLQGLHRRGQILGGFRDTEMVGICGLAPPGHCQVTLAEKVRILPAVVIGNRASTLLRVLRWTAEWSRRDLLEPHWHLGPVAVEPALKRRGVGHALMDDFCAKMDRCFASSYLETDKSENVDFYRQFGFTILAEGEVSGIRNWFMSRPAPGAQAPGVESVAHS